MPTGNQLSLLLTFFLLQIPKAAHSGGTSSEEGACTKTNTLTKTELVLLKQTIQGMYTVQ